MLPSQMDRAFMPLTLRYQGMMAVNSLCPWANYVMYIHKSCTNPTNHLPNVGVASFRQ